jgi:hypothetical protein
MAQRKKKLNPAKVPATATDGAEKDGGGRRSRTRAPMDLGAKSSKDRPPRNLDTPHKTTVRCKLTSALGKFTLPESLSDANMAAATRELNAARDGMSGLTEEEVFAYNYTAEQKQDILRKREEDKANAILMKKAEALMELQAQLDADAEERRQRVEARAEGGEVEVSARGDRDADKRRQEMVGILYARLEVIPGVEDVPKTKQKDKVTDIIGCARHQVSTNKEFHHRPLSNVEKSLYDNPLAKPVWD